MDPFGGAVGLLLIVGLIGYFAWRKPKAEIEATQDPRARAISRAAEAGAVYKVAAGALGSGVIGILAASRGAWGPAIFLFVMCLAFSIPAAWLYRRHTRRWK